MRLAWFVALLVATAAPAGARGEEAPSPDRQAAYEQESIGVRRLVYPLRDGRMADEQGHVRYDGHWDAFRGPDHHPIDEATFYRVVGREDLLARYQHQARIKKGVTVAGGALLLSGSIFAFIAEMAARTGGDYTCPAQGCAGVQSSQGVSPVWGVAIAGAGLVSLVVGHFLDPTPIDADEADALARDHDRSLRTHLGLTDTAARR
jgi:hypothetical protein